MGAVPEYDMGPLFLRLALVTLKQDEKTIKVSHIAGGGGLGGGGGGGGAGGGGGGGGEATAYIRGGGTKMADPIGLGGFFGVGVHNNKKNKNQKTKPNKTTKKKKTKNKKNLGFFLFDCSAQISFFLLLFFVFLPLFSDALPTELRCPHKSVLPPAEQFL